MHMIAMVTGFLTVMTHKEADMPQMTAVQIRSPGGPFEAIKREIPAPGQNQDPNQSSSLWDLS